MKSLARPGDKAEVLRRLKDVHPGSGRRWGRMTPHQMVCHLTDSFRMLTGEKVVSPAPGIVPRALIRWFALYVPLRWPHGVLTRPEMDQEQGGTRPLEFAEDVARLQTLVEVLTTAPPGTLDGQSHPIFGRMSASAWLRWGYLHMDHHLRQFGA